MADTLNELLIEIQELVEKLEVIGFGDESETVEYNGVTRSSIAKEIKDNYLLLQAMVAGKMPYENLASLISSGEPADNSDGFKPLAEVWNDSIVGNNGIYGWNGAEWVVSDYDLALQLLLTVGVGDDRGSLIDRVRRLESSVSDDSLIDDPSIVAALADNFGRAAAVVFQDGDIGINNLRFFSSDKDEVYIDGLRVVFGVSDELGNIVAAIDTNGAFHYVSPEVSTNVEDYVENLAAGISDEFGNILLGFDYSGKAHIILSEESAAKILESLVLTPDAVNSAGNAYSVTTVRNGLRRYISDVSGVISGYLQRENSITEMAETGGPIEFIAATGQSLSVGGGASGVSEGERIFTSEPVNPHHAFMFNTGTRGVGNAVLIEDELTDFVPAFESLFGTWEGETQGSGMMRKLCSDHVASGEKKRTYLYRSHGKGGAPIANLMPDSGYSMYENGLKELRQARKLATLYGRDIVVRAITWTQGEQDRNELTSRADYRESLDQLVDHYNEDWLKELPENNPPIMFIVDQLSAAADSTASDISLAQYDLFKLRADVVISTPKYFMEYSDLVHLHPKWYSILGEYQAKAYRSIFETGEGFSPVYPVSASLLGRQIIVTFNVPSPPLVFDTEILPSAESMGFEFYDDSDSAPVIESVILTSADSVQITLASEPTGSVMGLRYAYSGPSATGRAGAWGNLRDSDNTTSETDSNIKLHNWCITFDEVL